MELKIGESYEVEVIKLIKGGVIVLVNEFNDTSLIHISKISTGFVSNIEDYVNIGDSLVAECVPSDIKGAELSLLQLNLKPKTKLPQRDIIINPIQLNHLMVKVIK
jgi:predicted RNA-binding protein with RPS1 domain